MYSNVTRFKGSSFEKFHDLDKIIDTKVQCGTNRTVLGID